MKTRAKFIMAAVMAMIICAASVMPTLCAGETIAVEDFPTGAAVFVDGLGNILDTQINGSIVGLGEGYEYTLQQGRYYYPTITMPKEEDFLTVTDVETSIRYYCPNRAGKDVTMFTITARNANQEGLQYYSMFTSGCYYLLTEVPNYEGAPEDHRGKYMYEIYLDPIKSPNYNYSLDLEVDGVIYQYEVAGKYNDYSRIEAAPTGQAAPGVSYLYFDRLDKSYQNGSGGAGWGDYLEVMNFLVDPAVVSSIKIKKIYDTSRTYYSDGASAVTDFSTIAVGEEELIYIRADKKAAEEVPPPVVTPPEEDEPIGEEQPMTVGKSGLIAQCKALGAGDFKTAFGGWELPTLMGVSALLLTVGAIATALYIRAEVRRKGNKGKVKARK